MSEDNENNTTFEPDLLPKPGWRDRLRSLRGRDRAVGMRGAAAVGLAGLVIGGAGGFGLAAATHHDDGHRPGEMGRPWGGRLPSDLQRNQEVHPGPPIGGMPGGGLPPTTPPDNESYSGGSNS